MYAMAIQWKLKELLEAEGQTVYALADKMGGATRRPNLYTITSPDPSKRPTRVGFPLLDSILTGLKELTGKDFSVADIIESDNYSVILKDGHNRQ